MSGLLGVLAGFGFAVGLLAAFGGLCWLYGHVTDQRNHRRDR